MKQINIFIAGSKSLMAYREKLVLWANGKNYDYRRRGDNIQLNIYSFREVGDNQDVYNKVITEESDIILFLIERTIGDKTKEELAKAQEGYGRAKRPKIWVFTNQLEEGTRNYLEGALGRDFSIDFCSADRLVYEVNKRIDVYVKGMEKDGVPIAGHTAKSASRIWWIVAVTISMAWILAGIGLEKYCHRTSLAEENVDSVERAEKPMLLIAGGGSVANLIEERPGTQIPNLANYPNGYFVHFPTKSAWKMLVEEVVSRQDPIRYYPICISATKATDEDFCSGLITKETFVKEAIIVSCKLGEDSLAVYLPDACPFIENNPKCKETMRISVGQLKQLIESKKMNVYSTSFESGTRAGYCQVLGIDNNQLDEYLAGQFSEHSTYISVFKDEKPFLLLGSKHYQADDVCTESNTLRLVVDTDYVKPMMIYFMAYRHSSERPSEGVYEVPEETLDFLHHLGIKSLDDYIYTTGKKNIIKAKSSKRVINGFEDLTKRK